MCGSLVLAAIEVGLSEEVEVAVDEVVLLHHRRGHVRHAGGGSVGDLVRAVLAANAGAATLEPGVRRSELRWVLLDPH